jgi:hypothetical protein
MLNINYFKQTDTRVQMYCSEHKDMFKKLKTNILTFYKKYMNEYSVKKLKKIGHLEENGYKYKGVTNDWLDDYSAIKYKVNDLELSTEELNRYMPTQSIFITSVVYSIYNDLKYITYLYNEGLTSYYMDDYAKDVDLVLSSDSDVVEISYCRKFHSLGLGIPNLLLSEYTKLYNQVILVCKCKEFYGNIDEDYSSYASLPIKIISNINLKVMNGTISTDDKDMAYLAKDFRNAYACCLANGIETIESLIGMAKREVYKTQAKNGLRIATENEINSRIAQLSKETEYLIPEDNYTYLVTFVYLCTGDEKVLSQSVNNGELKNLLELDSRDMLKQAANYINSTDFVSDLLVMKSTPDIQYPKSAVDEIRDRGLNEKLEAVKRSLEARKDVLNSYEQVAYDIVIQGLKGKSLSDKQINVLNSIYQDVNSGKHKDNFYSKDVENKINACNSYFSYKGNNFISNLFSQVLKYKRCSEKQLKCINDEYEKMLEHQKAVLEKENQYVIKNTTEKKSDENAAVNALQNQDDKTDKKKKSVTNRKTKAEEKADIPTVIFGDYVFEDVD